MVISQKKRQKVIDLWNKDLNIPTIAKIMNHWDNTIRNILRKEGLYPRPNKQYGYIQHGVPKLITYSHGNQQGQQPSPQQTYPQQIAAEQGPKLLAELDKKNLENDDLNQKILKVTNEKVIETQEREKLQDKFDKLTDAIGKIEEDHQRELEQNKKDKEDLKQQVKQLTNEKETEKLEKEKQQNQVNKQNEHILKLGRELGEQKNKVTKIEYDMRTMQNGHHVTLEKIEGGVTTMKTVISVLYKKIEDITHERDGFKDKLERIGRQHEFDWILNLTVALLGFLGGIGADRMIIPKIKKSIASWGAEHGINTADYANLTSKLNMLQPNNHYKHGGTNLEANISGTLCSGATFDNYGETYGARYEPISNQQGTITQPDLYYIESGVTMGTSTTGALCCSGSCLSTFGNNKGVDYADFPYLDRVIGTASGITNSTNASIDPCSGAFFSYYPDSPQDGQPIHEYTPPLMIPTYSLPLVPPDNPSDSPLMKQIMELDGIPFEKYMEGFFKYLNNRVTLTKPSHDFGADLILERDGKRTVVQLKQQKEAVR